MRRRMARKAHEIIDPITPPPLAEVVVPTPIEPWGGGDDSRSRSAGIARHGLAEFPQESFGGHHQHPLQSPSASLPLSSSSPSAFSRTARNSRRPTAVGRIPVLDDATFRDVSADEIRLVHTGRTNDGSAVVAAAAVAEVVVPLIRPAEIPRRRMDDDADDDDDFGDDRGNGSGRRRRGSARAFLGRSVPPATRSSLVDTIWEDAEDKM